MTVHLNSQLPLLLQQIIILFIVSLWVIILLIMNFNVAVFYFLPEKKSSIIFKLCMECLVLTFRNLLLI